MQAAAWNVSRAPELYTTQLHQTKLFEIKVDFFLIKPMFAIFFEKKVLTLQ